MDLMSEDFFYDFLKMEQEPMASEIGGLLSPTYPQESTPFDPSRNSNQNKEPSSLVTSPELNTPVKSFIDEMLFSGSSLIINQSEEVMSQPYHWSDGTTSVPCPDTDREWLSLGNGTPVTALSNFMDPIFLSYPEEEDSGTHSPKEGKYFSNQVLSSDLITSTFQSGISGKESRAQSPGLTSAPSPHLPLFNSRDSSMLLRSALEGGQRNGGQLPPILTLTNRNHSISPTPPLQQSKPSSEMNGVRRLLSFPPITSPPPHHSPTSTSMNHIEELSLYELRLVDGTHFQNQSESSPLLVLEDECNLPNMEELILSRLDPSDQFLSFVPKGKKSHPHLPIPTNYESEFKIHSTTSGEGKWTLDSAGQELRSDGGKVIRRRRKKEDVSPYPSSQFRSSNGSPGGEGGSRKERSLHHCPICSKGFKDKYSVTVHMRTHTGEKPFDCYICGKSFRQKAHLAKHHQTHAAKGLGQGAGIKGPPLKRSNSTKTQF